MLRTVAALALGFALSFTASAGSWPVAFDRGQPRPPGCCKVCHKGKACGNTCIRRSATCHQPPGCACDG